MTGAGAGWQGSQASFQNNPEISVEVQATHVQLPLSRLWEPSLAMKHSVSRHKCWSALNIPQLLPLNEFSHLWTEHSSNRAEFGAASETQ